MFKGFQSPRANYTNVPNEFFDELMPEIKDMSELKVTLYMIRRTYGFHKSHDFLTIAQLCYGIETKTGKILDRGTGLSPKSVRLGLKKALARGTLLEFMGGPKGLQQRVVFLNTPENKLIIQALKRGFLSLYALKSGAIPSMDTLEKWAEQNQDLGGLPSNPGGGYQVTPQNKDQKKASERKAAKESDRIFRAQAFKEFWTAYPIKKEKSESEAAYLNLLRSEPDIHPAVMEALRLLQKHDKTFQQAWNTQQYVKVAHRFIKKRLFEDEYIQVLMDRENQSEANSGPPEAHSEQSDDETFNLFMEV